MRLTTTILISSAVFTIATETITIEERRVLREKVRDAFTHAYDNYMAKGFPKDVLNPLSCRGEDGWGSMTLTLLDTLEANGGGLATSNKIPVCNSRPQPPYPPHPIGGQA